MVNFVLFDEGITIEYYVIWDSQYFSLFVPGAAAAP